MGLKSFLKICLLVSLVSLHTGCGIKVEHKIKGQATVGTDGTMKELLNELKKSGGQLSDNFKRLAKDLNAIINSALGKDAQAPLPPIPTTKESWITVHLTDYQDAKYLVVNTNNQSSYLVLDLNALTLQSNSTSYKMLRNYSTENYFDWWFVEGNNIIQLYLQPNVNTDRLEGYVHLYLE